MAGWTGAILLLSVACAGPKGADHRAGEAPAAVLGPASSPGTTGSSPLAQRLALADLVHVDLWVDEGTAPRLRLEYLEERALDAGRRESSGAMVIGGAPVSVLYDYSFADAGAAHGDLRRVLMTISPVGPVESGAAFLGSSLAELSPKDRASVTLHGPSGDGALGTELTLPAQSMDLQRAGLLAWLRDRSGAGRVATTPAAAPFGKPTEGAAQEAAARTVRVKHSMGFLRFLERELLLRRPLSASDPLATGDLPVEELGALFFGDGLTLGTDSADAAVRALPGALYGIYAAEAGLPGAALEGDDRWAVPRLLALRQRIGPEDFRAMLRSLTDPHGDATEIGFGELTVAAEAAAPGIGARWVRAWLRGPLRPVVQTQWRHDAARGRVLLRVDQVHDLAGGRAAPAFPFRLPVRFILPGGASESHVVEIDKRRDLLEIPCEQVPLDVQVDPEDRLGELVDLDGAGTRS